MVKRTKWLISLTVFFLFIFSFTILAEGLYLWLNPLETKKNTVIFRLFISSIIKGCPVVSAVDDPTYTSDPGEGMGSSDSVFYRSSTSPENASSKIKSYLLANGFEQTNEVIPMYQTEYKYVFVTTNSKVFVIIMPEENQSKEDIRVLVSQFF